MAEPDKIVGMENGTADTVIAAKTIYGGAGNKVTHSQGGRNINMGDHGQYAEGAHANMNQGAPTRAKKDVTSLSSTELLELVRKYECSDETVTTFADERVTGRVFMADDLDELLSDLGITKKLDIRKLKSLKDDLSKGQ